MQVFQLYSHLSFKTQTPKVNGLKEHDMINLINKNSSIWWNCSAFRTSGGIEIIFVSRYNNVCLLHKVTDCCYLLGVFSSGSSFTSFSQNVGKMLNVTHENILKAISLETHGLTLASLIKVGSNNAKIMHFVDYFHSVLDSS